MTNVHILTYPKGMNYWCLGGVYVVDVFFVIVVG